MKKSFWVQKRHFGWRGTLLFIPLLLLAVLLPGAALAAEEGWGPGQDTWKFSLGGFFPAIDTSIQVNGVDLGDDIDIEDSLPIRLSLRELRHLGPSPYASYVVLVSPEVIDPVCAECRGWDAILRVVDLKKLCVNIAKLRHSLEHGNVLIRSFFRPRERLFVLHLFQSEIGVLIARQANRRGK